jgi:ABC-type proline/glycine betaine transport system substrate-binding protein
MRRITRSLLLAAATVPLALGVAVPAAQADSGNARVTFGTLLYEGREVRTVVTPAAIPGRGVDDLYAVPGQMAVTSVAPGDRDYHGGRWAVHSVSWLIHEMDRYPLTSEQDVLAAAKAGHVTIERVEGMDFVCPVAGNGHGRR